MLFDKLRIRDVEARNRIVVSPMCQYSARDGEVTDWHLVHLGKFAQGGAGIVFVEATAVEKRGRITHGDTGIWDDAHIAGLKRIASFIKSQKAIPAIQLAHAGRKASMARPWYGNGPLTQADADRGESAWSIVAPTETPIGEGWIAPRAFKKGDFEVVLNAFRQAARRAHAAGFEIVELHAAHGYLLHSFLSPLSNQRHDRYGGSFDNRVRLLREVAQAVRAKMPERLPLVVRISCTDWVEGGWDLEQSIALSKLLLQDGVELIDCSSGGLARGAKVPFGPGYQTRFAEQIRRQAKIKTGAVGLIRAPDQAEHILRSEQADVVILARELLRNPRWPLKAARALNEPAPWPPQYERARD
jgi:2,4-dienoyl-CoA reductase-like NADH-dependent reductase (Old Yellow Enzyme family)